MVRPNIRAGDYQGFGDFKQNKHYTTRSNQNGYAVQSFHAASSVLHLLMVLNRGGTPMTIMTIVAMVTRLAIHPGKAEAE